MYTTLYRLLRSERIEIPIIQRDYAQGRDSKVYLRERFLGNLVKSLKTGESLNLDFVYGTKEHGAMWPLDGQQRLTTLWLLHWYIVVRTNMLSIEKEWLKNFTYETRTSSRDFIISLCEFDTEAFNNSKQGIVDYIKDQTWYYSKYNQDPTIQGILHTLGGTNIQNSTNEDIYDGIEEILENDSNCLNYLQILKSSECPIYFLYKDMKDEELPLSDELYIKMNARGKQLTDFENFKADLISYTPNPDLPHKKLLDIKTASLIDNEWTDIFWNKAIEENVFCVDEIYFKFLRRYLLDCLISKSELSADDIQQHPLYLELYKGNKQYDGLKNFSDVLNEDTFQKLKILFRNWNDIDVSPHWDKNEPFAFIPKYIKKDNNTLEASSISQKERAIFHAIVCFYIENSNYSHESLLDWIRFAWNIVENSNLNTESAMIGAIKLFEELRPYSGKILDFLASDNTIKSGYASRQMAEERFKAKLITFSSSNEWKSLIHIAEDYGFFRGNISCLLRHDKKEFVDDIACFKKKYNNVLKYFDNKGIKEEYELSITKNLIKIIHNWRLLVNQYIFDTSVEGWKQNILNNDDVTYYKEIHQLLSAECLEELPYVSIYKDTEDWTKYADEIKIILSCKEFLNQDSYYGKIVRRGSVWRLCWAYSVLAFYPKNKHHAYNFDWVDSATNYSFRRNELLHHSAINVDVDNKEQDGIYWKWTIFFEYNGFSYKWDNQNMVYLLNRQYNPKRRDSNHKNEHGDEYFCIYMNELKNISQHAFLSRLTKLATEANS